MDTKASRFTTLNDLPYRAPFEQVLSQAVQRMASASSSAAGVPHLLQLAAGATELAARAQLQAAVLDLLLPPSAGPPSAEMLLRNLAVAAKQCGGQQLDQLRQAVQQVVGGSSGGSATSAVVRSAARACYQQLHSLCYAVTPAEAEDGSTADVQTEALHSAATALFVLGPLSELPQVDTSVSLAEARLLLAGLQHVCQAGIGNHNCGASRLLASTALSWHQLGPVCLRANGSSSQPSEEPPEATSAALALAHATLLPLQALLLVPSCSPSLRQAALQALFALPPAARAPLLLLRSLTAAVAAEGAAGAEESAGPTQLQLLLAGDQEIQLLGCDGCPEPSGAGNATTAGAGQSAGGSGSPRAAISTSTRQQQVQQSALVALLDLLGGLASTYEQQKAAFLQQLVAGAAHRDREQAQHAQQQAAGQTSHFGRPLRPASEWWVGTGQPAGGATEQAGAAREGYAAAADDYMRAEHLDAEHEAAAQRYLESLLEAADTAPACYLPLLERLAGQPAMEREEAEEERAVSLPAAVKVRGGGMASRVVLSAL